MTDYPKIYGAPFTESEIPGVATREAANLALGARVGKEWDWRKYLVDRVSIGRTYLPSEGNRIMKMRELTRHREGTSEL